MVFSVVFSRWLERRLRTCVVQNLTGLSHIHPFLRLVYVMLCEFTLTLCLLVILHRHSLFDRNEQRLVTLTNLIRLYDGKDPIKGFIQPVGPRHAFTCRDY